MNYRHVALLWVGLTGCIDLRDRYSFGDAGLDAGPPGCSVACLAPPATCLRPDTLLSSRVHGCSGSLCQLELTETRCANGCSDAGCFGEPCAGVSCTELPPARCLDASTLETVENPGTCSNGACAFTTVRLACPSGCSEGVCAGDVCAGKTCSRPPAALCLDSVSLRSFTSPGTCEAGTGRCSYVPVDLTCASGCANNACVNDPCAGITCTAPPASTCEGTNARKVWASPGTCTAGACGYTPSVERCPGVQACQAGSALRLLRAAPS